MFALKIETGNAAMQTRGDIATALQRVARVLDGDGAVPPTSGRYAIRDTNGNKVGHYELELESTSTMERPTVWEFETTAQRDKFLEAVFPERQAQESPGSYHLPAGDSLGVFCLEVRHYPVPA